MPYELTYMRNLKKQTYTREMSPWIQGADWWQLEAGVGVDKLGEGSQKVHISSYKMNKSWECNVQHDDLQLTTLYCVLESSQESGS